MEIKSRLILKNKETGLYWGNMAEPTKKLFDAWRFRDQDHFNTWISTSRYTPDEPRAFKLTPIKITIEESVEHANS